MATLTQIVPGAANTTGLPTTGSIIGNPGGANALGDSDNGTFDGQNTNTSGTYQYGRELGNVNADFGNMNTLSVQFMRGWQSAPSLSTWDSLSARVMASNGTTVLAASTSGGAFQTVDTNITTVAAGTWGTTQSFAYVNTGATKAQWDGAIIQIQWVRTRSKGGDALGMRVYEARLNGTYTVGATNYDETGRAIVVASYQRLRDEQASATTPYMNPMNGTNSSNPGTSFNLPITYAPPANSLVLAFINSEYSTTTPTQPTASGLGLTWVVVRSFGWDDAGTTRRLTLFRAMGSSPTAGTLTFDFSGETQDTAEYGAVYFNNVDTGGTNGSAAVIQDAQDPSTPGSILAIDVPLSTFAESTNVSFGVAAKEIPADGNMVSEAEVIDIYDLTDGTDSRLMAGWIQSAPSDGNFTWTWDTTARRGGGIAIEIGFPASGSFDETLRSIVITGAFNIVTDQQDMVETVRAVTITSTDVLTDSMAFYDLLLPTVGTVTVDVIETNDDTLRAINIVSTIGSTDTYTPAPVGYDETLRSVTVASTVSLTDQLDAVDTIRQISIVSTVGHIDLIFHNYSDLLNIVVTSTDVLTDLLTGHDVLLPVVVASTIGFTDLKWMLDTNVLTFTSTVGSSDSWSTQDLLAVSIVSTITMTDVFPAIDETGRSITGTVTVGWNVERMELWEASAEPYGHIRHRHKVGNDFLYFQDDNQYTVPDAAGESLDLRFEYKCANEFSFEWNKLFYSTSEFQLQIDHYGDATGVYWQIWAGNNGTSLDYFFGSDYATIVPTDRIQVRFVIVPNDGASGRTLDTYYKVNSSDAIDVDTGWTWIDQYSAASMGSIWFANSDIKTVGSDNWGENSETATGENFYQFMWGTPEGTDIVADWRSDYLFYSGFFLTDSSGGVWVPNTPISGPWEQLLYWGSHVDNHLQLDAAATVGLVVDQLDHTEGPFAIDVTSTIVLDDVYTSGTTYEDLLMPINVVSTVGFVEAMTFVDVKDVVVTSTVTLTDSIPYQETMNMTISATLLVVDVRHLTELLAETLTSTIGLVDSWVGTELIAVNLVTTIGLLDVTSYHQIVAENIVSEINVYDTYYPVGYVPPAPKPHVFRDGRVPAFGIRTNRRGR